MTFQERFAEGPPDAPGRIVCRGHRGVHTDLRVIRQGNGGDIEGVCAECDQHADPEEIRAMAGGGSIDVAARRRANTQLAIGRSQGRYTSRARFTFVRKVRGEHIVLRDVGPHSRFPTITNDAEAVVADLNAAGLLTPGRRVFYYDSAGGLDELVVQNGRFYGFAPGPGR
ncbi:MAG: hypothetical protein ACYS5V_14475 [Planctomycetota bacterium]|jgi:hypothetical protein